MPKTKALYRPDEFLSTDDFAAEAVVRLCRDRKVKPNEISDLEIKEALTAQILSSPVFCIRNYFFTNSKRKEIVLIDPFKGQLLLDIVIESQRKRGYAQRVVEIKPRQVGWTQWNIARGMWYALQPHNDVMVFVKLDSVALDYNKRLGDMYNRLGWMTPMRRIDNQKQLILQNPNPKLREALPGLDSQINVAVPGDMRGRTPNVVIMSEYAHWDDPSRTMDAVMAGMSQGVETCVVIDTTPNGFDDDYYPLAMEAVENNPRWVANWERNVPPTKQQIIDGILGEPDAPEDGWVPAFMSWVWHEEYTTKDESPLGQLPKMTDKQKQHLKATLGKEEMFGNDEEIELQKRWGASLGNLWWRRQKIRNDIQGYSARQKVLTFRQEYATSYTDCFIDYKEVAFDPEGMDVIAQMGRAPTARGYLRCENVEGFQKWSVDDSWVSEWEEMRFWAPSEAGQKYVIAADLGAAFESEDADDTYVQVLRRRDRKQVAVYESRAPLFRVREAIWLLYQYFNRAFTAIEVDMGGGKTLVYELWQKGLTNQYRWKRYDTEDTKDTKFLGWETSHNTRDLMQSLLLEAIAHRDPNGKPAPTIILRDQKTINQLLTVRRGPDGKIEASGANHDDAVLALTAIGLRHANLRGTRADDRARRQRRPEQPVLAAAPKANARAKFGDSFV